MFHHMVYSGATGAAVTLQSEPAIADTVFTITNNNFIFTDQMQLLGAAVLGATATAGQLYSPSLIPYGLLNLWPINRAVLPSSYPRQMDFRQAPFKLPMNENIQALVSDTANETVSVHMWVAPINWNRNTPRGQYKSVIKATASIATVAGAWSGPAALTFPNPPIGGWYSVTGAFCFCATARAFRLFFPRAPMLSGRQLRPGDLCSVTRGDLVKPNWADGLGLWGAYHTFEPLQLEVFGDAAGAATQELYLICDYLGQGDAGSYPVAA